MLKNFLINLSAFTDIYFHIYVTGNVKEHLVSVTNVEVEIFES